MGTGEAIEEVAAIVRGGALAGISAEGTVGDGRELLPIQKGAARIALAAGAPIIPAAAGAPGPLVQARAAPRAADPPDGGGRVRTADPSDRRPAVARGRSRPHTDRLASALGSLVDSVRSPGRGLAIDQPNDQT